MLSIAQTRNVGVGQVVVREGEPGNEMFAVARGRLLITRGGHPLAEVRAGGYFGELVLFDTAPRSATVTTVEDTQLVAIDREGLIALMRSNVELGNKLLWNVGRILAGRLRQTSATLARERSAAG